MRIHVRKISIPPKLYEELEELAKKKGLTVNQMANDIIVTGLKKATRVRATKTPTNQIQD